MREIKEIIIHCTATPEGREVTVKEIDSWHKQRGWQGVGYHYVIYLDGSIHPGRDINKVGAHCSGHNKNSIGICYVGGLDKNMKPKDTRTPEQKEALIHLLRKLKNRHPNAGIFGHRDFANKACPCFDAAREYGSI